MAVAEVVRDGTVMLKCDVCPDRPNYEKDFSDFNWNLSCEHIELFIQEYEDSGTLKPKTKYQMNLSPVASFLCRDQWASWVTFETGQAYADRGNLMSVEFRYDSEFYTSSSGSLGFIMPEDGRQSVRTTLWSWTTNELLQHQASADTEGVRCPQRNHSAADQMKFSIDCGFQAGIDAHIACIVFENCCAYCYRKTMGQDANFGMAGVSQPQQPRQRNPRAPRPGAQSTPSTSPFPTSTSSPARPSSVGTAASSVTSTSKTYVPDPSFAPPPWENK